MPNVTVNGFIIHGGGKGDRKRKNTKEQFASRGSAALNGLIMTPTMLEEK